MSGLPVGWASGPVGELANLTDGPFGSNLKTAHYVAAGPRVVRLQNIGVGVFRDEKAHITCEHFEVLRKYEVVPGDIVVASLGENAPRACIVPLSLGPAVVKADCVRLRVVHEMDPAFVMWMLNSPPVKREAAALIKGVGRPRLGLAGLKKLRLPVPPLDEQRRIVAQIEEHVTRLNAADAVLVDALRRVSGLVNARLDAAVDGHPLVELGAVTTAHRYGTSVKCSPSGEVAVLRIPNVRGGKIDTSDLKFATSRDLGDCHLESGDLLIIRTNGSRALIGRAAVVDRAAEGMAFASYLIRVRPTADLDPEWGALALSSPRLRGHIESRAASTAGQYNLNLAALRSLPVPLPPVDEQRGIVSRLAEEGSALQALGAALDRARRRSASLRRAILERAFRGELVPQDPSDEPASVLLERIRKERAANPSSPRRRRVSA